MDIKRQNGPSIMVPDMLHFWWWHQKRILEMRENFMAKKIIEMKLWAKGFVFHWKGDMTGITRKTKVEKIVQ